MLITSEGDADQKKKDRECAPDLREFLNLTETNCRNCDHRHVQAVIKGPAFDDRIAKGPTGNEDKEQAGGDGKSSRGTHGLAHPHDHAAALPSDKLRSQYLVGQQFVDRLTAVPVQHPEIDDLISLPLRISHSNYGRLITIK